MKQTFLIVAAALFALSAGFLAQRYTASTAAPANETRLRIALPDVDGTMRDIDEWQDNVLIINFWATWCPPCLKEIPQFVALQTELTDNRVRFIGIAVEDAEPVVEFLKGHPVNYPILIGGDEGITLSRQLGNMVGAVPFTIVVNRLGQIVHRHPGELSREKLLEILKPLID